MSFFQKIKCLKNQKKFCRSVLLLLPFFRFSSWIQDVNQVEFIRMLSGKGFELWHCSHESLNTSYVRPFPLQQSCVQFFTTQFGTETTTRQVLSASWRLTGSFDKTVGCSPVINKHLVNRSRWVEIAKKISLSFYIFG